MTSNEHIPKISQEEIRDFLIERKLSSNLEIKIKRIIDQDKNISKNEALEILLDFDEINNY